MTSTPLHESLGNYVVAFLDVLGQKSRIQELRNLPTNEQEQKLAAEIVQDTAGCLLRFRQTFDRTFTTINTPTKIFESIPEEKKTLALQMRRNEAKYRFFSDALIATVPLENDDEYCTSCNGINSVIWASCSTALGFLAADKYIRGGIEVGWGVPLGSDEIYGAALERAYTLESRCAEYPRIVIGDELWNYLCTVEDHKASTPFGRQAKNLVQKCKEIIIVDKDGKRTIDIAGPAIRTWLDEVGKRHLQTALNNVRTQEKNWQNHQTLGERYRRLRELMEGGMAR